jgi:hypothetical protein
MAILGKVTPTQTVYTLVYAVPTGKSAVATAALTNTSSSTNTVSVAISKSNDLGVSGITVSAGGTGLTSIPTLAITGDGTGATAVVSTVTITAATINNGGTGYLVGDKVTLVGGTGTAATFTVTGVDANGAVTSVNITDGGSYSAVITGTTAAVTGGTGTKLVFTVSSITYGIKSVTVTAAGNDYSSAPVITASAGTGITLVAQMVRAAIDDKDAVEWNVNIPTSGVLERTGLTLGAGDAIFVKSSVQNGLNAFVFGVEAIA